MIGRVTGAIRYMGMQMLLHMHLSPFAGQAVELLHIW